jgi:hypothetical protein
MRRLSRRTGLAVAFAVFVFIGLSLLLARALTGAGAERAAVVEVVRAEARGDGVAVLEHVPACAKEPACARVTLANTAKLRAAGHVEVLAYEPSVRMALEQTVGTGRIAWRTGTGLPVVQCVRALREGPLDGGRVELLSISAPIGRESACP